MPKSQRKSHNMKFKLIIDTLEDAPEAVRGYYVKTDDGKFKLNIDGDAAPKAELDAAKKQLDDANKELAALKANSKAPDGKTWKEAFEGSQTANKAIRDERDAIKKQLDEWKELGTPEEIKQRNDELDALKAKGAKADDLQQQVIDLKKANRQYADDVNAQKAKVAELQAANTDLAGWKAATEKQLDLADAEAQIAAVVEGKGFETANQKALKRNLVDRYKAGDLKRGADGKLVEAESGNTLDVYAKDTMEAYNLVNPTQAGISNPPSKGAPGEQVQETTIASIAGMLT